MDDRRWRPWSVMADSGIGETQPEACQESKNRKEHGAPTYHLLLLRRDTLGLSLEDLKITPPCLVPPINLYVKSLTADPAHGYSLVAPKTSVRVNCSPCTRLTSLSIFPKASCQAKRRYRPGGIPRISNVPSPPEVHSSSLNLAGPPLPCLGSFTVSAKITAAPPMIAAIKVKAHG